MRNQKSKIKNQKLISLFLIMLLGSLFFPLVSFAGEYIADGKTVTYEGLVPCGKTVTINGESRNIPCQFCHFFVMLDGILDFALVNIVFPVAVLLLVIGGAMFIFAAGNPSMVAQGKSIMTSVAWGLVIIFAAWIIVNTFFAFIGVAETDFGRGIKEWYEIDCPIELP